MSEDRGALQQLMSWKEIARHLHVAVRTAQAWEREKGLPVLRMIGKKGHVIADPVELDRWKQSTFHKTDRFSNLRYFKIYAVLLTALLIVAVVYGSIHIVTDLRDNSLADSHLEQQPLVVVDHSKKEPVQKNNAKTDEACVDSSTDSALDHNMTFRDVDGDGELETILDYSPVNSSYGPNASDRVAGIREKARKLAAVPLPASEISASPDR